MNTQCPDYRVTVPQVVPQGIDLPDYSQVIARLPYQFPDLRTYEIDSAGASSHDSSSPCQLKILPPSGVVLGVRSVNRLSSSILAESTRRSGRFGSLTVDAHRTLPFYLFS